MKEHFDISSNSLSKLEEKCLSTGIELVSIGKSCLYDIDDVCRKLL